MSHAEGAAGRVEVGNLSLLGYDPFENFTGRAPIEAAAQGIELGPEDWAVRCNLVTIEDQVMRDFTADHISTEEATKLLADGAGANRQRAEVSRCAGIRARRQLSQPADLARREAAGAVHQRNANARRRTTSPTSRSSRTFRAGPGSDVLTRPDGR